MYLDKPLRDHNLLQAIARTNRPLPTMKKRTGVVVDYFGVFDNLEKALNFDENIREESLIDWDALKATVPGEVARCMESVRRHHDRRHARMPARRTARASRSGGGQELRAEFQEPGTALGSRVARSLLFTRTGTNTTGFAASMSLIAAGSAAAATPTANSPPRPGS